MKKKSLIALLVLFFASLGALGVQYYLQTKTPKSMANKDPISTTVPEVIGQKKLINNQDGYVVTFPDIWVEQPIDGSPYNYGTMLELDSGYQTQQAIPQKVMIQFINVNFEDKTINDQIPNVELTTTINGHKVYEAIEKDSDSRMYFVHISANRFFEVAVKPATFKEEKALDETIKKVIAAMKID